MSMTLPIRSMKTIAFSMLSALLIPAGCSRPAADQAPTPIDLSSETLVQIGGGLVTGAPSESDPEIFVFKGVPYAAPPVDELRWQPPQPVMGWDGVREATTFGPPCRQFVRRNSNSSAGGPVHSEDCLSLNIWAPRRSDEARPVMVWLHGGGFAWGSSSRPSFDGSRLASEGVILVTINYRLGVFGFFAHPALSAESEHGASGNYGLMDMVAALEWIQNNISAFGGDPHRVTIFGESAGAGAVMSLMVVPKAGGLFHGAISESSWVFGWDRPLDASAREWEPAENQGLAIATALEADQAEDPIAFLRALSADEVQTAATYGNAFLEEGFVWGPNVDGWIIPEDPVALFNLGRQHDVPLIAGINRDEGTSYTTRLPTSRRSDIESHLEKMYPGQAGRALEIYDISTDAEVKPAMDHLITDMYFAGPTLMAAEAMELRPSKTWLYHFTKVPPTERGAGFGSHHGAEIPYVFGNLREDRGYTAFDRTLSDAMIDYWVQFATTGDPNVDGLPSWPAFNPDSKSHLRFGEEIMAGTDLHAECGPLFLADQNDRRASAN